MKLFCSFCGKDKTKCKKEFLISSGGKFPFICINCVERCNSLMQKHKSNIRKVIDFYPGE